MSNGPLAEQHNGSKHRIDIQHSVLYTEKKMKRKEKEKKEKKETDGSEELKPRKKSCLAVFCRAGNFLLKIRHYLKKCKPSDLY